MSSIFKIKPWLTVEDTARYINLKAEQDVKSSDIYDLALNLKLTAYLRLPKAHMSLSHEAATYAEPSFTLQLQQHPEVNLEFSLPVFRARPLPRYKNMGALNGMDSIETEINKFEGVIQSGAYELAMMDGDKFLLANLKQSGDHPNPTKSESREQPITLLTTDEVIHYLLNYGVEERFNPVTTLPLGSDVVFKREEIDNLIEEINVTIAPKCAPLDTSASESEVTEQDEELTQAQREKLLRIIGALAKLAAHLGGVDVGGYDKPNAQGLLRKLETLADGELLEGLGKSTWANRIKLGKEAFERGK